MADNGGGGGSGGGSNGGSGGGSGRGDGDESAGGPSANTLSLVALLGTTALDLATPQHAGARQQQTRLSTSARSLRRGLPLVDAIVAVLAGLAAIAAACKAASAVLREAGYTTPGGGASPSTGSRFEVAAILLPLPSAADSAPRLRLR